MGPTLEVPRAQLQSLVSKVLSDPVLEYECRLCAHANRHSGTHVLLLQQATHSYEQSCLARVRHLLHEGFADPPATSFCVGVVTSIRSSSVSRNDLTTPASPWGRRGRIRPQHPLACRKRRLNGAACLPWAATRVA